MKVAIVDRYLIDQKTLSDEICKHYFYPTKKEDVFVYQFDDNKEFIEYMYDGVDFRIAYLEESSTDLVTFKTIQELLPNCAIVLLTSRNDYIPLNNFDILTKPYDSQRIYDTLVYHMDATRIKPRYIRVNERRRIRYIDTDSVYYLESNYGKVYVHTKDTSYVGEYRFYRQYDELLCIHGFISISQSLLINVDKVVSSNGIDYHLDDGTILRASQRKRVEAFRYYQQFKESVPYI